MSTIEKVNAPVAENILRIIVENGYKKQFIAKQSGLTTQEFSDMLNNRRVIKVYDIPRIAKAMNVRVEELFA